MGSILMQDAFFSAVTEGKVDPAFHPSGVGEMGTVYSQGECGCQPSRNVQSEEIALNASPANHPLRCDLVSMVPIMLSLESELTACPFLLSRKKNSQSS